MKTRLIEAAPIEGALEEIAELESAQIDSVAREALGNARAILDNALARAANPEFADGVDPETFGRLHCDPPISAQGVRKRAHRQKWFEKGAAEKRGHNVVIFPEKVDGAA